MQYTTVTAPNIWEIVLCNHNCTTLPLNYQRVHHVYTQGDTDSEVDIYITCICSLPILMYI